MICTRFNAASWLAHAPAHNDDGYYIEDRKRTRKLKFDAWTSESDARTARGHRGILPIYSLGGDARLAASPASQIPQIAAQLRNIGQDPACRCTPHLRRSAVTASATAGTDVQRPVKTDRPAENRSGPTDAR
jgi:hypothetical protein